MRVSLFIFFALTADLVIAKNVGIGEPNPTSRLEVKAASGTNPPLQIKTSTNEELLAITPFSSRYYTFIGGRPLGTLGVLNITNRYHPGFAPTLLQLNAFYNSPEAGSISSLGFSNSNKLGYGYRFDADLSSTTSNRFALTYLTDLGNSTLMAFLENGALGIGGNPNNGKVDVFHNSLTSSPQLALTETEADFARLSFRNTAYPTYYWSIAGLTGSSTLNDRLNFFHPVAGDVMSLTGDGKVGIGNSVPAEKLDVVGNLRMTSDKGILLNSSNRPLITRGWDAFTGGAYNGIGRWGLFMEPNRLTVGFPSTGGSGFNVIGYNANSSIGKNVLDVTIDGAEGVVKVDGNLVRPSTGSANLLPIAYGNINGASGAIRKGTGNFTCSKFTGGYYIITMTGENYSPDDHIVSITLTGLGPGSCRAFKNTVVSANGLIVLTYDIAGTAADRDFSFVVYKP